MKNNLIAAIRSNLNDAAVADIVRSGKVDIAALDRGGHNALHLAAARGLYATCVALLDSGVDVNARSQNYSVPLGLAIRHGAPLSVISLLVDRGASLMRQHQLVGPPLGFALRYRRLEVARILLERGADPHYIGNAGTYLHEVAAFRNLDACHEVLTWGIDIEARNCVGETALKVAASLGDTDMCSALLKSGACPDAPDLTGETPRIDVLNRGSESLRRLFEAYPRC